MREEAKTLFPNIKPVFEPDMTFYFRIKNYEEFYTPTLAYNLLDMEPFCHCCGVRLDIMDKCNDPWCCTKNLFRMPANFICYACIRMVNRKRKHKIKLFRKDMTYPLNERETEQINIDLAIYKKNRLNNASKKKKQHDGVRPDPDQT